MLHELHTNSKNKTIDSPNSTSAHIIPESAPTKTLIEQSLQYSS